MIHHIDFFNNIVILLSVSSFLLGFVFVFTSVVLITTYFIRSNSSHVNWSWKELKPVIMQSIIIFIVALAFILLGTLLAYFVK